MRTIADLPEESIQALDELAKRDRVSRAELLRRAVREYLARRHVVDDQDAFGLWQDEPRDALRHEDELRGEWRR